MRKMFLTIAILLPLFSLAQFGIKAGVNFANVTHASDINSSQESGFMAGVFLAPPSTGVMGFRTELIFSRQGYSYKTNTNTGVVNLDYILLPQLMQINITKFFFNTARGANGLSYQCKGRQHHPLAAEEAVVLTEKSWIFITSLIMDLQGGIEIHPFKGLLVGARYNISLGNLYKDPSSYEMNGGQPPSFIPAVDVKNNVLQIFSEIFGNSSSKKKQQTQPQQ